MIDIHCHLLPQIDDGSDSEEKSLQQLRLMYEGGIRQVFLTAHFTHGYEQHGRDEDYVAKYHSKLESMRSLVRENGIDIGLNKGFEVYVTPQTSGDIAKHDLSLGNSRYVLLETDLNGLPVDFYLTLFPILRQGYKPILAHAERYVSIMQDPREAKKLIQRNIYIQVNSGSLLGAYGKKVQETAWLLVRNGWAHLLGSDDHARSPYGGFFQAREKLEREIDGQISTLLTEEFPHTVLDDGIIPYKYVYLKPVRQHRTSKSFLQRIFG
ncbi:MAG: CpsB/CapC family capsule biosynthesis tyrosine phosphatase [Candidatus Syntrophosphaera sp.]